MMNKILILLLSFATLISCSSDVKNNTGEINIRLSNASPFDFKDITVNTSTGNVKFEDVNSGEFTNYKTFDIAYRYAFIELDINGNTYTLQPLDYVGETPLKDGFYTYKINANESQEQYERLTLSLIED